MDKSIKLFAVILDSFKGKRMESKGKRRGRKPGGRGRKPNPIGEIPYDDDDEDGIYPSLFDGGSVTGKDPLSSKDTSQDGSPEDGGKREDVWFWRTLFQFRLRTYLLATEGQIQ